MTSNNERIMKLLSADEKISHIKREIYILNNKIKDTCIDIEYHLKELDIPDKESLKHIKSLLVNYNTILSQNTKHD